MRDEIAIHEMTIDMFDEMTTTAFVATEELKAAAIAMEGADVVAMEDADVAAKEVVPGVTPVFVMRGHEEGELAGVAAMAVVW